MTKKEIEESNKIIAKFLGGEIKLAYKIEGIFIYTWTGERVIDWRRDIAKLPLGKHILIEHLKFHEDWNWLIAVVEKIESLSSKQFTSTKVSIIGYKCEIGINIDTEHYEETIVSVAASKLEALWLACVAFIRWYNRQIENNEE